MQSPVTPVKDWLVRILLCPTMPKFVSKNPEIVANIILEKSNSEERVDSATYERRHSYWHNSEITFMCTKSSKDKILCWDNDETKKNKKIHVPVPAQKDTIIVFEVWGTLTRSLDEDERFAKIEPEQKKQKTADVIKPDKFEPMIIGKMQKTSVFACHVEKFPDEMKGNIVLAFDIERSGGTSEYETIGIGASVVDNTFTELDSLFLPAFFPLTSSEPTRFEERCWDEFWSKHEDQLNILIYDGGLSKQERQREMIQEFQAFRAKWETYAIARQVDYLLVSDNPVFDGGFINELIFEHFPGVLPIPYNASTDRCGDKRVQKYGQFISTHSEQKGFLMAVDPSYLDSWGFSNRINELFDVPVSKKTHDHNPANDAFTIAFEQQILFAIREGRIKRR